MTWADLGSGPATAAVRSVRTSRHKCWERRERWRASRTLETWSLDDSPCALADSTSTDAA